MSSDVELDNKLIGTRQLCLALLAVSEARSIESIEGTYHNRLLLCIDVAHVTL
jgi:hypothetical protein